MPIFNFEGIKGLSARDRELWEKQNIKQLEGTGYNSWSESDKIRAFRDASMTNKFGKRADYNKIKKLSDETKDSIFKGTLSIEDALNPKKTSLAIDMSRAYHNKDLKDTGDFETQQAKRYDKLNEAIQSTFSPNKTKESTISAYYEDLRQKSREMQSTESAFDEAYKMWDRAHKMSYQGWMKDVDNVKDIAAKNSSYYKRYNGSDFLKLTDDDWKEITTTYQATLDSKGERAANNYLNSVFAENVSRNMSNTEKMLRGFKGMGASAAGAAVSGVGMAKGALDYMSGNYKDVEGLNGFQNFVNAMMDNEISRYGNDIVKYGSLFQATINKAKESGISEIAVETATKNGFLGSLTNIAAEGLSSQGFTIASMGFSVGASKLAGWGLGTLGKAIVSNKTGQALMATRGALSKLQKTQNAINGFVIPGLAGTMEGAIEGLNTKQDTQKEALQLLDDTHKERVAEEAKSILQNDYIPIMNTNKEGIGTVTYKNKKTGKITTAKDVYQSVWDSHMDEYQESLKQIDYASSAAGVDNFMFNSLINGFANTTLKVGLQAVPTRKALADVNFFKRFQPTGGFRVSGSGENLVVTPTLSRAKQIYKILKEPTGEAIEESLQHISDKTASSAALNNVEEFVKRKYNGDSSIKIGDTFSTDWKAAWEGFSGALGSKEMWHSAMMGAVGSIMGIPTVGIKSAYTGRYKTDENGNLVKDKNEKPILETTYFGRGIKANGERESLLNVASRVMPIGWRSPIVNAYRESKNEREALQAKALTMQNWARDPKNKDKWDGLVGTWSWAERMQRAAEDNDEYDYRNSQLGKTINDIYMLQAFEGTEFYDTQLRQINEIATLEPGTEKAQKYIQAIRDDININQEASDEGILLVLQENARKMITTMDNISEAKEAIRSTFGQVDADAEQALVYNRLAEKDWEIREKELEESINSLKYKNSRAASVKLTDEQKEFLAKHNGSIEQARRDINSNNNKILEIQNNIRYLNNLKRRTKQQDKKLKELQDRLEGLKLSTIESTKIVDSMPTVSREGVDTNGETKLVTDKLVDSDIVLNEEDIMRLPAKERAQFLLKGAANRYNAVHGNGQTNEKSPYSAEQQAVIDKLVDSIEDQGLADIVDYGRIIQAREKGAETYAKLVTDRESLYKFIDNQKKAAAREVIKEKYKYLDKIEDYNQFLDEMDNLFKNGTLMERQTVASELIKSKNAFWERYNAQNSAVQSIRQQLYAQRATASMNLNDIKLMDLMSEFLIRNNIDLKDEDAVVKALSNLEENGNSAIANYVNNYNKDRETPITLDNISKVMGEYKEAIKNMNNNSELRERLESSAPETTGQSKPKSIFDSATSTPQADAGTKDLNGENSNKKLEEQQVDPLQTEANEFLNLLILEQRTLESIKDRFKIGTDRAQRILDYYNANTPKINTEEPIVEIPIEEQYEEPLSPEEKDRTSDEYKKLHKQEVLNTLRDKLKKTTDLLYKFSNDKTNIELQKYDEFINSLDVDNLSEEEILNAIDKEIENLAKTNNGSTYHTALVSARNYVDNNMDSIGNTVDTEYDKTTKEEKTKRQESKEIPKYQGAELMEPEDIFPPNNPLHRLFAYCGSKKFISNGLVKVRRTKVTGKTNKERREDPKIRYYYDANIGREIADAMGEKYNGNNIPIIAVYPIAQEDIKNYPNALKINGISYMPIGILAANNNTDYRGSNIATFIRDNIGTTQESHFIKKGNSYIESTPRIESEPLDSPNTPAKSRDVRDDIRSVVSKKINQARQTASDNNQEIPSDEINKLEVKYYRELVKKLHDRFITKKAEEGGKTRTKLYYRLSDLKTAGNSTYTDHLIFETPMGQITNSAGISIKDFLANDANNFRSFNDYTSDFISYIEKFLKDAVDNNTPFSDLNSDTLNSDLQRIFYTKAEDYSIRRTQDGYALFLGESKLGNLSLGEDGKTPTFNSNEIIKNLLLPNGDFRANLHHQLDFETMMQDDKQGYDLLNRAIGSGVLRIAISDENWERPNRTIIAETPKVMDKPTPAYRNIVVVNDDSGNISGQNDDEIRTASGELVDGQTGTNDKGKIPKNPVTDPLKSAINIVTKIIEDTTHIKLTNDEKNYLEERTKTLYERVTSLIREVGEEFNELWKTPSTNIGTTVDNFVRDFFELSNTLDNKITSEQLEQLFTEHIDEKTGLTYLKNEKTKKVYYNFSRTNMMSFANQLIKLQMYFKENDLTVFPNDITVTGVLEVDGQRINVAGTLDILAVDKEGNFHIFDMKTHRWEYDKPSFNDPSKTELEVHKEKWDRQLSLYKRFLEDKYLKGTHHRVVECAIIPIKVDYTIPTEGAYSADKDINKLQYKGKDYIGATVSLDLNGDLDNNQEPTFKPITISGKLFNNPALTSEDINTEETPSEPAVESKKGDKEVQINPTQTKPSLQGKGMDQYSQTADVPITPKQEKLLTWNGLTDTQRKTLKKKWGLGTSEARKKFGTYKTLAEQKQELNCLIKKKGKEL